MTFNVTVASTPPTPVPAGTVNFLDASSVEFLNITVPLDSKGNASTTTSSLPVGSNGIVAQYTATDNLHATSDVSIVATVLAPPAPQSPVFSPPPGNYDSPQTVTLTDATSGVEICYTTNGTQPGILCAPPAVNPTLYTGPISVTQTTTIQAVAIAGNVTPSPTVTAVYSIDGVAPSFVITGFAFYLNPGAISDNTSWVDVTSTGGFSGSVALSAAITSSPPGALYPPKLSFGSTSPVTITGVTPGVAVLTVSTTAASSATLTHPLRPGVGWFAANGAALACLLVFSIPTKRRRWQRTLGLLIFFVFLTSSALSCGGNGGGGGGGGSGSTGISGTTPGIYTITVTGTSGSTTASGPISLTVF